MVKRECKTKSNTWETAEQDAQSKVLKHRRFTNARKIGAK